MINRVARAVDRNLPVSEPCPAPPALLSDDAGYVKRFQSINHCVFPIPAVSYFPLILICYISLAVTPIEISPIGLILY
jgi:hypothetical protein